MAERELDSGRLSSATCYPKTFRSRPRRNGSRARLRVAGRAPAVSQDPLWPLLALSRDINGVAQAGRWAGRGPSRRGRRVRISKSWLAQGRAGLGAKQNGALIAACAAALKISNKAYR